MNGLPEPYELSVFVVVRGKQYVISDRAPNADGWRYVGTPSDLVGPEVHFSHEEASPVRPVIRAVRSMLVDAGLDPEVYAREIAVIQAENVEPVLSPLDELLAVVEHIARRGHVELRAALNIYREATS